MGNTVNILAVGDVVSEPGVEFVRKNLWRIRDKYKADIVILNGENSAKYNGMSRDDADILFASGADIITSGNHIWHKREIFEYLEDKESILRPANYPSDCPGHGYTISSVNGYRLLCINVLGVVFMESLTSPFEVTESILKRESGNYDISVVDIHAEATSEKAAFARYFDGRIDIVFGTHTHVQTADNTILPKGTAFITDIGMTGAIDSVLGVDPSCSIERFIRKIPVRFEPASGRCSLKGAFFKYDTVKKCVTETALVSEEEA